MLRQFRNSSMLKKLALPALLLLLALPALAQPPAPAPAAKDGKMEEKKPPPPPEEKSSVTKHSLTLDGKAYPYTATAGTLLLRDDEGTVKASVFYVAYTLDGVKDPGTRPVTFSFNGGPGAASLWVHLGAFGPRRVARTDEGFGLPPPGKLVDNEDSILDTTDLVFIDPVSTGYSRPAPGQDPKQFHGVKQDIDWVAEFIRLWVTRNQRWASPKFVAGESYGTTRAAGLAYQLADRYGMMLNGIVLVSTVLNWQDQDFHPGNERPCFIHLPTYAAAAWYHKKLPPEALGRPVQNPFGSGGVRARRVRAGPPPGGPPAGCQTQGAGGEDRPLRRALPHLRGALEPLRADRPLHQGAAARRGEDPRPPRHPLQGGRHRLGGRGVRVRSRRRLHGRPVHGGDQRLLRRDLKYETDLVYERLSDKVWPWDWTFHNQYVNVAEYLRQAMTRNPHLQVLMAAGVYDLATPFFDTFFTRDHLGLPQDLRGNVRIELYQAGHMMYIRKADHDKLRKDVTGFIRKSAG